jgi:hypothetical protein
MDPGHGVWEKTREAPHGGAAFRRCQVRLSSWELLPETADSISHLYPSVTPPEIKKYPLPAPVGQVPCLTEELHSH